MDLLERLCCCSLDRAQYLTGRWSEDAWFYMADWQNHRDRGTHRQGRGSDRERTLVDQALRLPADRLDATADLRGHAGHRVADEPLTPGPSDFGATLVETRCPAYDTC